MKIIHVIPSLENGGAEKFVVELGNAQSIRNDVSIITFKPIDSSMTPPQSLSTKVRIVVIKKRGVAKLMLPIKILKMLFKNNPDIIHLHLNQTMMLFMPILLVYRKQKIVHTVHSNLNDGKVRLFKKILLMKPFLKNIEHVCLTKSIYKSYKERYPKLRFSIIENGITAFNNKAPESDLFKQLKLENKAEKYFLSVGALNYNKNQKLLVDSFEQMNSNNAVLIIGEDTSENNHYSKSLIDRNVKNIFFLGGKSNIQEYMTNADALILSSFFEGLPIVVLEAMSVGLPVIATPAGGVRDIISNGINGFISEDFSVTSFVKAIRDFISLDNKEVEKMKINARKIFNENFNIKICEQKYFNLYNSIIKS